MVDQRESNRGLREVYEDIVSQEGDQGPDANRYEDLTSAAHGLWRYGKAVKVLGYIIVAAGILGALYVGAEAAIYLGTAVLIGVVGLAAGAGLHALGTFFAAAGEGLLAVRDTAINTGRAAAALQAQPPRRAKK